MLIDSHCHLNYLDDPVAAISAAKDAGVVEMLCIGVEEGRIAEVLALAASDGIWASVGEHPDNASGEPLWIDPYLSEPRVIAVGETGLDYFHTEDPQTRRIQRQGFTTQMALAEKYGLPVIVHTRNAVEDTLSIMAEHPLVQGVLHCFTEDWAMAEVALEMGYYISISGIVTFKNASNVRDVAVKVPADRLLIETDAPWLAPVPHRGKQNQPAFVSHTAHYLAELRGVDIATIASTTSANFYRAFPRTRQPLTHES